MEEKKLRISSSLFHGAFLSAPWTMKVPFPQNSFSSYSCIIRAVIESRLGDLGVGRGVRWIPVFCGFMLILEILGHYHLDHFPPLYLGIQAS